MFNKHTSGARSDQLPFLDGFVTTIFLQFYAVLFFDNSLFPEMAVQDDQSVKTSIYIQIIYTSVDQAKIDFITLALVSRNCPTYFSLLPLVSINCPTMSNLFHCFFIGFQQLFNILQYFTIGCHQLFNLFH